jgi:hypothetical protein
VQAAAKQLSALGTRLAAVVRRGNAAEERVSAHSSVACVFSFDLLIFTSQHGLIDATKALHSCVTLPLECGSALMASADASIGESTEAAYKCLFTQTQLLSGAMSSAMTIGDAEHLAAQLAPPERLLPWLSAAISKLFALHGTLLGRGRQEMAKTAGCLGHLPGRMQCAMLVCITPSFTPDQPVACCAHAEHLLAGSSLRLQVMLVQVIYTIGNSKYLAPHAAAVQRDASLQRSLLQLLVPLLHASAAALQLPAERRPAEFHIKSVAQVVYALTAPMLVIPFMERFSPTSAEHSTYAQRVLQSTAQLFVAMPASYPPEAPCAPIPVLWSHMLLLLGSAGVLVKNSIDAHLEQGNTAFSDAQRRNMLQQLQAALSRLPTALHWAVKDEQLHAAAGPDVLLITCGNIGELWMLLVSQELQANLRGGWAEVKVFCAASSALLQALPHASALAGLAATGVATGSQQHFGDKLTKLLVTATLLTLQAIKQVADSGPSSAADSAAAAEALWQLHTTLCRCIHYSAAAPAAGIRFDKLLLSLGYCMQVAEMVSSRVCAAPPGSTASHSVAKPRQAALSCISCLVKQQPVCVALLLGSVDICCPAGLQAPAGHERGASSSHIGCSRRLPLTAK